jgi:hypothetical protein
MDMVNEYGIRVASVVRLMNMPMPLYKICTPVWGALRLAALTPFLAATGAYVDSIAIRGEFKPVVVSYHAICARDRRDWRCARVRQLVEEYARNEKTPGAPGCTSNLN